MNIKKRITALALSAVMMVSQAMPVLADNATTSTGGDGNILAYTNNQILAPTAIKISFNPQGYDVYETADAAAKLTNAQIVSLNYGFASNATNDMLAKVSFEADLTGAEIEFVETEEEVTNAKRGELKMYLAVATNKTAITAAADASNTAFEVKTDGTSTVTDALLADVAMTPATENNVAFVSENQAATAEFALSMNKAVYTVDPAKKVTFDTDQDALEGMMVLSTLGGINGFTFTGAMNADADWTKAGVETIAITPTYDLTQELTGEEEILSGTFAQLPTEPSEPAVTTLTGTYDSTNTRFDISLPSGVTAESASAITNAKVNDLALDAVTTGSSGTKIRVTKDAVKAAGVDWSNTSEYVFTFTLDGVNYKATIEK